MTKRTRNVLIAAGTAAFVLLGVVTGILVTGDDSRQAGAAPPASSTTTSSSTTTTAIASSSSVPVTPTTSPTFSSPTPDGTPIDATGALLTAPAPMSKSTAPPSADCQALGDVGWTVKACGTVSMAAGPRVWLIEHKPVPDSVTEAWRAYVLHWSQEKGRWLVDLLYLDDAASQVFDVNVLPSDLTGDGRPELVFGFRFTGSGAILGYDVVTHEPGSDPAVSVHRELSHGAALVSGGKITDYEAKYPNDEPNCCPAYTQKSTVAAIGGAWYLTAVAQVREAGAGNL